MTAPTAARLGVTYRDGAGPATVFVKAADPAHKALLRLTSGMFHEPRLFTCGADLPLEHPAVYTARSSTNPTTTSCWSWKTSEPGEPIPATAADP
jgi:hypothetical protein